MTVAASTAAVTGALCAGPVGAAAAPHPRVLMLGWEFPPFFAGGVGVVCEALATALARRGMDLTYLMPWDPPQGGAAASPVRLLGSGQLAPGVKVARLPARLVPYAGLAPPGATAALGAPAAHAAIASGQPVTLYPPNLLREIERFARQLEIIAAGGRIEFDLIHAHDWTTFPGALALKRSTGRPLLVHVHITEFDKSGGSHADPDTYAIEKAGLDGADLVATVSRRIAQTCIERYGTDPAKIRVVHNGVNATPAEVEFSPWRAVSGGGGDKVVLFLGRVTLQKGPEYFLRAARRVLDVQPNVTFIMAGSGDQLPAMVERSAELGLGAKMLFAGFVTREAALSLYRRADLFVMPSVSEPFGIVPLEAMSQDVPVIISRQSGVSEVVRHALKVDFWDVEALAGGILAALRYPALAGELRRRGRDELAGLNWDRVADRVISLYHELCWS